MNENQNISSVKEIYGCFSKGDIEGVIAMLDDNVKWIIPAIKNYPPSGTHLGKAAVKNFFMSLPQYVEGVSFEQRVFCGDDSHVFVQGSYEFKAIKSGKPIISDWVEVFTFENGKIIQYEEYCDTAAFQNAFS